MKLFCLPYAGGSASAYFNWKNYLSEEIEIDPIELKGRGKRFGENFYNSFDEVIEDIFSYIKDNIDDCDYAIFGHSMGSLLAYELYYKIKETNLKNPKHIFFSSHIAPHVERIIKKTHNLTKKELISKINNIGGTPEEILKNEEFLEIYLPIIKNDFELIESYIYKEKANKILCDITVLHGSNEMLKLEDMLKWERHTVGNFMVYELEGNHFYINDNIEKISGIINETLIKNEVRKGEYYGLSEAKIL